jgi:thiol-disulfide isomerase/thioredoxin
MKFTDLLTPSQSKIAFFFYFLIIGGSCTVIIYYIYQHYQTNKIESPDIANANRRLQSIDVHFFHTKWCPWCKKTMPAWEDFVKSYNNTVIGSYTVNCIGGVRGIDCSNEEDPEISDTLTKMKITKFPTIKFTYNNTTVDFSAKITKENLYKCIKEIA